MNAEQEKELYDRFEEYLITLSVLLSDFVSKSLFEDIEFFIIDPHITATCITNVKIVFQLGKLAAVATGINALLIEALYMLVIARDGIHKGRKMSCTIEDLDKVNSFLETARLWKICELNY